MAHFFECPLQAMDCQMRPDGECQRCKELAKTTKRKIETEFVYPPIPDRRFDWSATFEGYEPGELIGRGPTEQAAIADLLEQESEQ